MHLARAWCITEDSIRNMRMIPRIKGVNMSAIALVRRLRRCQRQVQQAVPQVEVSGPVEAMV